MKKKIKKYKNIELNFLAINIYIKLFLNYTKKNGVKMYYCTQCVQEVGIRPNKKQDESMKIDKKRLSEHLKKREKLKKDWNEYHKLVRKFEVPKCDACEDNLHVFTKGTRKLNNGFKYRYNCKACVMNVHTGFYRDDQKIKVIGFVYKSKWKNALKQLRIEKGISTNQEDNQDQPTQCLFKCGNDQLVFMHERTSERKRYSMYYCADCYSVNMIAKDPNHMMRTKEIRDPEERKESKESWNRYYYLERGKELLACKECGSNQHSYTASSRDRKYRFFCKKCNVHYFANNRYEKQIKIISFNRTLDWMNRLEELEQNESEEAESLAQENILTNDFD